MIEISLDSYRSAFQSKIKDYEYHDSRARELIQELDELMGELNRDYPDQAGGLVAEVTAWTLYTEESDR